MDWMLTMWQDRGRPYMETPIRIGTRLRRQDSTQNQRDRKRRRDWRGVKFRPITGCRSASHLRSPVSGVAQRRLETRVRPYLFDVLPPGFHQ